MMRVEPLHALRHRFRNRLALRDELQLLLKELQHRPGILALLLQVLLMNLKGRLLILVNPGGVRSGRCNGGGGRGSCWLSHGNGTW